ncbi:hypothetical protein [Azospirillum argentinense]
MWSTATPRFYPIPALSQTLQQNLNGARLRAILDARKLVGLAIAQRCAMRKMR